MNSNDTLKGDIRTNQSTLASAHRAGPSISAELAARTKARREAEKMFEKVKAVTRRMPLQMW
ncbi:MAG: hypothetical protein JWO08_3221 [Verrucomicrobiaceae bacterium]|nr:hypothetical protein [Verrucomicrobiaceae bacterium]